MKGFLADMDQLGPEAVLNANFGAGITSHYDGKNVILNIPGLGSMTYKAALRAGVITVNGVRF